MCVYYQRRWGITTMKSIWKTHEHQSYRRWANSPGCLWVDDGVVAGVVSFHLQEVVDLHQSLRLYWGDLLLLTTSPGIFSNPNWSVAMCRSHSRRMLFKRTGLLCRASTIPSSSDHTITPRATKAHNGHGTKVFFNCRLMPMTWTKSLCMNSGVSEFLRVTVVRLGHRL